MTDSSPVHALRVGYGVFGTPQLSRMIDYYVSVIGLNLVAQERGRAFLACRTGQLALELRDAEHPACAELTFEIAPDQALNSVAQRLKERGIESEIRSAPAPGIQEALAFKDPNGTVIQLFNSWQSAGATNFISGICPIKLGHVAFTVLDAKAVSQFYVETLGFRESDWIHDKVSFLRCNSDHHSANFFEADHVGVQHIAFEVTDFSHLRNACDILVQNNMPVICGPVRAGPGHNVMVVHLNPDGHAVECYTELDQMKHEDLGYFDPRPWHRDHPQRPKVWNVVGAGTWGPPLDTP